MVRIAALPGFFILQKGNFMVQTPDSIYFEPETEFIIGNMRFLVTAHYDDSQDTMQDKIARLLRNDIKNSTNPQNHDTIAA